MPVKLLTETEFRAFRKHAAALLEAAQTERHARTITKAWAVCELLARHYGYRVTLNITAKGAALHVVDDEGREYSAHSELSAVDCVLDMAGVSLEGHLTEHVSETALVLGIDGTEEDLADELDEDTDEYDIPDFDDRNEGDTTP